VCGVQCAICGVWHYNSCSTAVFSSAGGSAWQCLRQCAAVRQCACAAVHSCLAVRKCAAVRQCMAVRTDVCGSARMCAAVHLAVCGSARGSVWQCLW
jgi:hypothetical protein